MSVCRHCHTGDLMFILLLLYPVAISDSQQVCLMWYMTGCKTVLAMGEENPYLLLQLPYNMWPALMGMRLYIYLVTIVSYHCICIYIISTDLFCKTKFLLVLHLLKEICILTSFANQHHSALLSSNVCFCSVL